MRAFLRLIMASQLSTASLTTLVCMVGLLFVLFMPVESSKPDVTPHDAETIMMVKCAQLESEEVSTEPVRNQVLLNGEPVQELDCSKFESYKFGSKKSSLSSSELINGFKAGSLILLPFLLVGLQGRKTGDYREYGFTLGVSFLAPLTVLSTGFALSEYVLNSTAVLPLTFLIGTATPGVLIYRQLKGKNLGWKGEIPYAAIYLSSFVSVITILLVIYMEYFYVSPFGGFM